MEAKRLEGFKVDWLRKAHNNITASKILVEILIDNESSNNPYTESQRVALIEFKNELMNAIKKSKALWKEMCL